MKIASQKSAYVSLQFLRVYESTFALEIVDEV